MGVGASRPGPLGRQRSAVVTSKVNLRSGPGTNTAVVTTIPVGSTLRVSGCGAEWCEVAWNGHSGFVIARNLDIGTRQVRFGRPPFGYASAAPGDYHEGPPLAYGPSYAYGPPPVLYGPRFYYGPRYSYGWRRHW